MMPERGAHPRGLRSPNLSSRSQAWPGFPLGTELCKDPPSLCCQECGQIHPALPQGKGLVSVSEPQLPVCKLVGWFLLSVQMVALDPSCCRAMCIFSSR